MYKNAHIEISKNEYTYTITVKDYHKHKDFVSTIIQTFVDTKGQEKKPHLEQDFTLRSQIAVDKIVSLETLLKNGDMTDEYFKILFKSLAFQLENLHKKNLTILHYKPKHTYLFVFDFVGVFIYLNPEDVYSLEMERIMIDCPFEKTLFTAPEIKQITAIPDYTVLKQASYWSFAALLIHYLSQYLKIKEPKNIKDMTTVLNKIKHKKMYWALQRCLEAEPERRYLIFI